VQPSLGRAEAGKLIVMAVIANARVKVIFLNMSFSSVLKPEAASADWIAKRDVYSAAAVEWIWLSAKHYCHRSVHRSLAKLILQA
jgi:hypothetical protein